MTSTVEPTVDTVPDAVDPDPAGASGAPVPHVRVAVVGTGFSGLGTAIRLRQAGIRDFLVFERADEVGGTWRDNSYPGAACDVMSLLYSFSFAQNPKWTSTFGGRDELFAYLRDCADRFGVRPHIRFGHELLGARWEADAHRWRVETSGGTVTAQVLVTGSGYLSDAAIPAIPGLDGFTGTVFHSSTWDHDHDLTGERVAVIGTGASAIQFVPKIQPKVGALSVFQRTAPWVAPKVDKKTPALQTWMRSHVPGYLNFRRNFNMWGREVLAFMMSRPQVIAKTIQPMAEKNLAQGVADPELRARLTPDYSVACKRLLFSNDWYPAITAENSEVVTEGISAVGPRSITTADGREREVDTIILATGFSATERPIARRLSGADGRTLAEHWSEGMSAYAGTTVAGFPNLFMLLGPNTTLGHSSQTVMIEAQITHVMNALEAMDERGLASVEVRPEAQARYNEELDESLEGTVWNAGNCTSWYLDANGRNPSIWPTYTWRFRRAVHPFDPQAYRLTTSTQAPASSSSTASPMRKPVSG